MRNHGITHKKVEGNRKQKKKTTSPKLERVNRPGNDDMISFSPMKWECRQNPTRIPWQKRLKDADKKLAMKPVLSERVQNWHVGTCRLTLEAVKFMTQTELGGKHQPKWRNFFKKNKKWSKWSRKLRGSAWSRSIFSHSWLQRHIGILCQ